MQGLFILPKIKPSDAETSDGARDEHTNELRPLAHMVAHWFLMKAPRIHPLLNVLTHKRGGKKIADSVTFNVTWLKVVIPRMALLLEEYY